MKSSAFLEGLSIKTNKFITWPKGLSNTFFCKFSILFFVYFLLFLCFFLYFPIHFLCVSTFFETLWRKLLVIQFILPLRRWTWNTSGCLMRLLASTFAWKVIGCAARFCYSAAAVPSRCALPLVNETWRTRRFHRLAPYTSQTVQQSATTTFGWAL